MSKHTKRDGRCILQFWCSTARQAGWLAGLFLRNSFSLCILNFPGRFFFALALGINPCSVCCCYCILHETTATVTDVISSTQIRAKWGLRSRLQSRRGWRQGWPKVSVAGLASLGRFGWGMGYQSRREQ